jgi:hypothetical protein
MILIYLIIILIALLYVRIEPYDYIQDYEKALNTGITTGPVFANPNYTYGLGWIN